MATRAANKRLTREYALIQKSPPPYITAHPSETNILEWHYILTGPPDTPYAGGQYWGTLIFPPEYPFAPPAIRMHTPSGRFQPSTRLCLSISDFHPKSFNPAWEVSTILIGLLSFMTSEEMTTGSVGATHAQRVARAEESKWWNSTGGGSTPRTLDGGASGKSRNANGFGNVKAGDGGEKFRAEWPELDNENWAWMRERKIDPKTGRSALPAASLRAGAAEGSSCTPGADALRRRPGRAGSNVALDTVRQQAREVGQSWVGRHKIVICVAALFSYVILARILGHGATETV